MSFCSNCGKQLENGARFCSSCGKSVINSSNGEESTGSVQRSANDQQYTCPRCGTPINSFNACCPSCGCEMNQKAEAVSCRELCEKLDMIEASRPKKGFFSMVKGIINDAMDKDVVLEDTDKRKIDLISHFIIVNRKIEVLDFLILANSRINACNRLLKTDNSEDEYSDIVNQQMKVIWNVKLNEALTIGDMILNGDADYYQIKSKITGDRSKMKVCTYCGGSFKGLFNKVCSECGKPKNY